MRKIFQLRLFHAEVWVVGLIATLCWISPPPVAADERLDTILGKTEKRTSLYLDSISLTSCSEHVLQEKMADSGKVTEKEETVFDYVILLSNAGGDLNLLESRVMPKGSKPPKKQRLPLLVSNGFSTLFLVFHPYYSPGFRFRLEEQELLNGHLYTKVHFQHLQGTRSPAALAVRGREYPLELTGTAWIDPETGVIAKITAGVDSGMEDVGLRTLHSEIAFAPVTFKASRETLWLPQQATVEVESRHQHWRNTHQFSEYKQFLTDTTDLKEQAGKK